MALRHIIFALIFGLVVGLIMQTVLGGSLITHILTASIGALAAAWFVTRSRE